MRHRAYGRGRELVARLGKLMPRKLAVPKMRIGEARA